MNFKTFLLSVTATTLLFSCNSGDSVDNESLEEVENDFIVVSGTILNSVSDTLKIYNTEKREYENPILLNEDGSFNDTMTYGAGLFYFLGENGYFGMYLETGYKSQVTADAEDINNSLVFSGAGEMRNTYYVKNVKRNEGLYALLDEGVDSLTLISEIDRTEAEMMTLLDEFGVEDSTFVTEEKAAMEQSKEMVLNFFTNNQLVAKLNGQPSPAFDYDNFNGGKTSLKSLRGKYVYIDIWATWCGPCIGEIPSLKEVEEAYHEENITFVSISIDEQEQREKWETMVTDKELGGTQLIADQAWSSDFVKGFHVYGIPRFILLDPNGVVLDADAKRPSDPELRNDLDVLFTAN